VERGGGREMHQIRDLSRDLCWERLDACHGVGAG
jgi:hypothetical protein